jgi:hypothetical protein
MRGTTALLLRICNGQLRVTQTKMLGEIFGEEGNAAL